MELCRRFFLFGKILFKLSFFKNLTHFCKTLQLFLVVVCIRITIYIKISFLDFNDPGGAKQDDWQYIVFLQQQESNFLGIRKKLDFIVLKLLKIIHSFFTKKFLLSFGTKL